MGKNRNIRLRKNFWLMFGIQALTEMRIINVVSTLFMLSRGLTISQIFMTAVIFSVVAVITEVPSSYLADKWSRKGLIIISIICNVLYWTTSMFAQGFVPFVIAISLFSTAYSMMSGSDEALMYDTARELGETRDSIKMLGRFYAASRIFKMVAPILAASIAFSLQDWQFKIILGIDLAANLVALFLADYLTEPKHFQEKETVKTGVLRDAIEIFRSNPLLIKISMNKTVLFLSSFIIWRVSSEYFTKMGIPIIVFGIVTSMFQATVFVLNMKSHSWFGRWTSETIIRYLNWSCVAIIGLFLSNEIWWKLPVIALGAFAMLAVVEVIRWPYFSDLINKQSRSYNRATMISGTNLLTEVFRVPVLMVCSWLVGFGYQYLFTATLVLGLLSETAFAIGEAVGEN
jgi:MFS family permease